ncbi:hypothetical protein [Moraxella equi]|nr:hypothetical protein [Moraxella equi]
MGVLCCILDGVRFCLACPKTRIISLGSISPCGVFVSSHAFILA